jgi:hypothetical protein
MKRIFIFSVLSIYVFSQLKPFVVIVEDVLAHTFWKMQHMATVHYENGHYHLHSELSNISVKENKTTQEKAPSSEKSSENSVQDIHEFNFNFESNNILIPVIFHQTQDVLTGFTRINSPPPKV